MQLMSVTGMAAGMCGSMLGMLGLSPPFYLRLQERAAAIWERIVRGQAQGRHTGARRMLQRFGAHLPGGD